MKNFLDFLKAASNGVFNVKPSDMKEEVNIIFLLFYGNFYLFYCRVITDIHILFQFQKVKNHQQLD